MCGNLDDFIRGVDSIPDRDVLDFNLNKYEEMLIEFLIYTNMYFLNGKSNSNDFTSVSTIGKAVVDYCFVRHASLNIFSNFSVTRSSEFINQSSSLSTISPISIPGHSLLKWNAHKGNSLSCTDNTGCESTEHPKRHEDFIKFDVSNTFDDFLNEPRQANLFLRAFRHDKL